MDDEEEITLLDFENDNTVIVYNELIDLVTKLPSMDAMDVVAALAQFTVGFAQSMAPSEVYRGIIAETFHEVAETILADSSDSPDRQAELPN